MMVERLLCAIGFLTLLATAQITRYNASLGSVWINQPGNGSFVYLNQSGSTVSYMLILVRGNFGCGFYGNSSSFVFGVVIFRESSAQVVWSANGNNPVGENSTLTLNGDGVLMILDETGRIVWNTPPNLQVQAMELQASGNLVLQSNSSSTLWQSFASPGDTLVEGQALRAGWRMSSLGDDYSLELTREELKMTHNSVRSITYWSRNASTLGSFIPYMIYTGGSILLFVTRESDESFARNGTLSDEVIRIPFPTRQEQSLRYLRLDSDGNLRLYELLGNQWTATRSLLSEEECELPSTCGDYAFCTRGGNCQCLNLAEELRRVNAQTCELRSPFTCDANNTNRSTRLVDARQDIAVPVSLATTVRSNVSRDICLQSCAMECTCKFALYAFQGGDCLILDHASGFREASIASNRTVSLKLFLKVEDSEKSKLSKVLLSILVPVGAALIAIVLVSLYIYNQKSKSRASMELQELETGQLKRFSYKQLEHATNNFGKKLGQGGFGSVFLATLNDGSQVAVKRLESSSQGQKEFKTEVNVISSIHHFNLVRLRGFCAEKHHRLLVYEYMPRRSLDKWLFLRDFPSDGDHEKAGEALDWKTRLRIALGIARGLKYLHDDCSERILHLDVKPQNVLLDSNFDAKLCDFGMSKLMKRNESEVFTMMRGTRGYLAPEWLQSTITERVDVYSFGIVLLEIVSGQRCLGNSRAETSTQYFPNWASSRICRGQIMEIADSSLHGELQSGMVALWEQVELVIYTAMWCIQEDSAQRPSMEMVIRMLEGRVSVSKPPNFLL
ncbi:G-type lectin S-receptor-like serine/threonine-protein kinase SD2-5 [Selaginella moellendorffii]|nr:G-type lectin S-receptor-like serine/threonine-protein kinase SD2-5 [Selaginella moellendorffii]|eukprot:XP_024523024.1 G-type lectin S-receptor-like serine/threonine-protein kinase SD2-5 [Selaginella moellendorffii]